MADRDDENLGSFYMGRGRQPVRRGRSLFPRLFVALAVVGFFGIVLYAYPRGGTVDLADVPVIKADPTPVKSLPADPGGIDVPHQDSTVFEYLVKDAEDVPEKLNPPPEEPMDKAAASAAVAAAEPAPPPPPASAPAPKAKATTPAPPTPAVPAAEEGEAQIWLGSYPSVAAAEGDWTRLQKKYPGVLAGLGKQLLEKDVAGKGTFYRLYAGPLSAARAAEVCAALTAGKKSGCIVVKKKQGDAP